MGVAKELTNINDQRDAQTQENWAKNGPCSTILV